MDELIKFLTARLDETEADARGSGGDGPAGQWARNEDEVGTGYGHLYDGTGEVVVYDEGAPGDVEFDHIARHDPARVLREVAAKRGRLALMIEAQAEMDAALSDKHAGDVDRAMKIGRARGATVAVKHDAAVWNDHPDYPSSGGSHAL